MVSSKGDKVDGMKHRALVVLLVLGAAAAGFMSVGWGRAAGGPDLGDPVVVSPPPEPASERSPTSSSSARPSPPGPTGNGGESTVGTPDESTVGTPDESTPKKSTPAPRKTKAEPVKPPSPRPGGGGGDDDDDDGGDDGDD